MAGSEKTGLLSGRLKFYSWLIIIAWTGCIAASLWLNLTQHMENTLQIARNSAQITFENDILYRKWAAKQGGVYVPVSEHTLPNPYLNVPNRDVTTSSGLSLSLVNPAYMARQVNQMAANNHGSQGHLTSLNAIRPENRPDAWEAVALKSFEQGVKEVSAIEKIENKEYMRLMRPFVAEKSCLKCHGAQGYREGDIRGGISVSVPMEPLWAIDKPHLIRFSLAHLFLWMIGLAGIMVSRKSLAKQILARETAEVELTERTLQLENANKDLESFSYSVSHDLRAPLRAIDGYIHMIAKDHADKFDDDSLGKFNVIRKNARKMGRLIDDLLEFSRLGRHAMDLSVINMEDLVNNVWKECLALNPGREIALRIDPLPEACGDRPLITQVLSNLLANAVKFTAAKKSAAIEIGGSRENGEKVYYVKDNGAGFDMRYYDKLFGVFQRLHDADQYEGTGVGLAIVKQIVSRHGGRVWAEGRVNTGATFYFTLPEKV
jgi:signal transduction histidine kinase